MLPQPPPRPKPAAPPTSTRRPLKNVFKDYPPTFLIHGAADTDVPHEQSVLMAEVLKRSGVRHAFVSVPGA
ncbi:MAG: prolyl oligopeptidase family serine peptidase [Acidobacteria bacterium]|nr:prolyl oligopeptidase family serine peptidase [Acidobacteriota bacterium]